MQVSVLDDVIFYQKSLLVQTISGLKKDLIIKTTLSIFIYNRKIHPFLYHNLIAKS